MGDLGPPGLPGLVGDKGEQGPIGDCKCTDGVNVTLGQKEQKGEKGGQGPVGMTGEGGPQSEAGAGGTAGPPGPCMASIQSAFAAGLTSSYPPPNVPVVSNSQQRYDPSCGTYTARSTAPTSSATTAPFTSRSSVGLFHSFVPVIKTTEPQGLGTTSHSVVLRLARGDQVWVPSPAAPSLASCSTLIDVMFPHFEGLYPP